MNYKIVINKSPKKNESGNKLIWLSLINTNSKRHTRFVLKIVVYKIEIRAIECNVYFQYDVTRTNIV